MEVWSDTRFTTAYAVCSHLGYHPTHRSRDLHDLSDSTEYHFRKQLS